VTKIQFTIRLMNDVQMNSIHCRLSGPSETTSLGKTTALNRVE
jgi:hypothetical protein